MKKRDDDLKDTEEEEEETKGSGALSSGVLDAFEETAPVDPLAEEDDLLVDIDKVIEEEDEDDEGEPTSTASG